MNCIDSAQYNQSALYNPNGTDAITNQQFNVYRIQIEDIIPIPDYGNPLNDFSMMGKLFWNGGF